MIFKALFFDLDKTLCDTLGADTKAKTLFSNYLLKTLSPDSALRVSDIFIRGIYRDFDSEELKNCLSRYPNDEALFRAELLKSLLREEGVFIDQSKAQSLEQQFNAFRYANYHFFEGVKAMLMELKKNYALLVITNGPAHSQKAKIESSGIQTLVDGILIGGELPEQKPHPSIFKQACKLANCQANEALHIGDDLFADILGAKNAGIKSVWIKNPAPEDLLKKAAPDFILNKVTELKNLLLGLAGEKELENNF